MKDQLDAPMVEIQFVRRRVDSVVLQSCADPEAEVLDTIMAENCRDGVASFKIEAAIQLLESR